MNNAVASTVSSAGRNAAGPAPTFTWVNHASFILDYGGVRLICDPWLSGAVFNHGWRHISPTVFTKDDFKDITHLWYSHQHPDHFFPPDLAGVDPEVRKRIVVMYHRTIDKKVIRFCRGIGFKRQIEMDERRWYDLSPTVSVACGTWLERDSWLAVRTPHGTILNVNDCYIDTPGQVQNIARSVGPVKVLLTQYSYAQWVGNASQPDLHTTAAREHLQRIKMQIDGFRPEYVVPFASFVFFCSPENFYMNHGMNSVGGAARFIEEEAHAKAVVLYPGDRWRMGDPHDWHPASARYQADFDAKVKGGPVEPTRPVALKTLQATAAACIGRLRRKNPLYHPMRPPTTTVHLNDLGCTVLLSLDGLRVVPDGTPWDLETTSDDLHYCLKAPWGANTLFANGRYTSAGGTGHNKFFAFFKLVDWNDHGYQLAPHRFVVLAHLAMRQFGRKVGRRLETMRGALPKTT